MELGKLLDWARATASQKVLAIKGVARALVPLGMPSRIDVNVSGKKLKRGVRLWQVGVSILKSELYSATKLMRDSKIYTNGYCHFLVYSLNISNN